MLRPNRVIQAIERNPDCLWQHMAGRVTGASYIAPHGVALTLLGKPHPLFNFASMASISEGSEEAAIRHAIDHFTAAGLPWDWQVGPASTPVNLAEHLMAAGFTHSYDTPGMGIDLRNYRPQQDLGDTREVTDDASMGIWLEAMLEGFGMPSEFGGVFVESMAVGPDVPARYFYACENGRPVACAMVYFAAGVAGIYCVCTLPDARRKGYGEQVMRATLAASLEDGYDVAILHSSRMGKPLYEKLGFTEYCQIAHYVPPSSALV